MKRWIPILFALLITCNGLGQSRSVISDSILISAPYLYKLDLFQPVSLTVFDNFTLRKNTRFQHLYADTTTINTSILYQLGSRKFQNLIVEHGQNLNDSTSFYVFYSRRTYDGSYLNEAFSSDHFNLSFSKALNKWEFQFHLLMMNGKREMNEGLIHDSLFTDTLIGRQFIPVLNEGSLFQSRFTNLNVHIGRVIGNDSSFRTGITFVSEKENLVYYDENFGDSIAETRAILLDSTRSLDGFSEGYEKYGLFFGKNTSKNKVEFSTGIMNRYYRNYSIIQSFKPYAEVQWLTQGVLKGNCNFIAVFDSISTLNLSANFRKNIDSNQTISFLALYFRGNMSNYFNSYISNHYSWNTSTALNTQLYNLQIDYQNKKLGLKIGYKSQFGSRLPVWNDSLSEYSLVQDVSHYVNFEKVFRLAKGWFVKGIYTHFKSSDNYYQYPRHSAAGGIKRSGQLFKGKMKCGLEIEYKYFSSFNQYEFHGPGYDLVPSESEIAAYGYFNVYGIATLGGADLFLSVYHASEGLFNYNYFDLPHFPGKDRIITFGVKLYFND